MNSINDPPPSGRRDKRHFSRFQLHFTIPIRFAQGIVRLTLQTSSRRAGIRFQLGSLKKEGTGKTCPFFKTT
jgi:hypothetical protein